MAAPAGSLIVLAFRGYEGDFTGQAARRYALDPDGNVIEACGPLTLWMQYEAGSGSITVLDDGRALVFIEEAGTRVLADGTSAGHLNYDDPANRGGFPPGWDFSPIGSDGGATIFFAVQTYVSTPDFHAIESMTLYVGRIDAATGSVLDYETVETAAWIEPGYDFGVRCCTRAGVVYYVVPVEPAGTAVLKRYAIGSGPLPDVATYAPGDPSPGSGIALSDGTLLLPFRSAGISDTLHRVDGTTGAILQTYAGVAPEAGEVDTPNWGIFAGVPDDASVWIDRQLSYVPDDPEDPEGPYHEEHTVKELDLTTGATLRIVDLMPVSLAADAALPTDAGAAGAAGFFGVILLPYVTPADLTCELSAIGPLAWVHWPRLVP